MEADNIKISINLNGLRGELQRSLQKATFLVGGALHAMEHISADMLRMPVSTISMTFDPGLSWTTEEAQEQYGEWILANGFREIIESTGTFLESAHTVLSLWEASKHSDERGGIRGEDWNRIVVTGKQRFHRLGFPDKLNHLANEHQIRADDVLASCVVSINQARNCLVHRSGRVSQRDTNCADGLEVRWRRMVFLIKNEDGEKEMVIGEMVEKDSVLALRIQNHSKVFPLGGRVQFVAQEFADISWCLFLFGNDLVQKLNELGVREGLVKDKSAHKALKPDAANSRAV